jgi:steroid delta-isomerase-like uncharacterized protein
MRHAHSFKKKNGALSPRIGRMTPRDAGPAPAERTTVMSGEQNKELARRYLEEVWGMGNVVAEEELLATDFVDHMPPAGTPPTREGHQRSLVMFRTAFPDMKITVEDLIAEGDKVVDRWTVTGTQTGDLFGMTPTGKRIEISGMDILRIEDGKIREIWHVEDVFGMLRQLGVFPQP